MPDFALRLFTGRPNVVSSRCEFGNRMLLALWLLLLAGCQNSNFPTATSAPSPELLRQYSIQQFLENTSFSENSFSPDGSKILVSSDQNGIDNAVAIDRETGNHIALTSSSDNSIKVVSYFPADERFLFLADQGGNELDHLYVQELDGTQVDLTPGKGHQVRFLGWAADGSSLFMATNERDPRHYDIFEVLLEDYSRRLIYSDTESLELLQISPDKRYIAFARIRARHDIELLVYDLNLSQMRSVTAASAASENHFQAFSHDGAHIYYTTNRDSEFSYLVRKRLAGDREEVIYRTNWDVTFTRPSPRGSYLVIGVNRDAHTRVEILRTENLHPVSIAPLSGLNLDSVSFSADERYMAFYRHSSRSPQNLYSFDFVSGDLTQLTQSLNPAIDENQLVEAELVRFRAPDGLEIPGLLYKPRWATASNKVPAMVWVHGGPGGQSRAIYHPLIQYLVNHGYAVYAINNRGSSGYGRQFFMADDRGHGRADLDDCVASKSMLVDTGYIDPRRIGIIGTSYGGYLAMAALSFRPEEFSLGVNIFGFSNWIQTLQSMPPWWQPIREALYAEIGHPERDSAYLRSISPLFYADQIVKPVMLLQGTNDPRVLRSETSAMVAAIRNQGTPVEYLEFEDEGHSLRHKESQRVAYAAILNYLDRYLQPQVTE